MKKKFNITKTLGKKNTILAIVALVLVMMTAVGTSFSWIEEVSQVEFNSNEGQETPLHVGDKLLNAEVNMNQNTNNPPTETEIDLGSYFNESGNMHLSPCYGDGDNFYFPVQKKGVTTDNDLKFRAGTKDDANVNYLSATFKVKSSNANTAYWFEKVVEEGSTKDFITFKKSDDSATGTGTGNDINLKQYLRVSVTVDGGNTSVYAYNTNGKYYKLASSSATSATQTTGRRLENYMYSDEDFNNSNPVGAYKRDSNPDNKTGKHNQGAGDNLDGNTLFKVNKYSSSKDIKNVTVKIWLEYNSSGVQDVKVSNINLKITSAWAKNRRIYVKDETVHEEGYDYAKWLGSYNATLHWGLKNNLAKHWPLLKVSGSDIYYADIPAVYNNEDVVLFRCSSSGYNNGNKTYTGGNVDRSCWNYWETTFPDSFHSEVYTVYSNTFGTWNENDVGSINFINSSPFGETPKAYMWDSNSVYGAGTNDKVVKNADWPGVDLTKLKTSSYKGWKFTTSEQNNCTLKAQATGYYTFTLYTVGEGYFILVTFSTSGTQSDNSSGDYYIVGSFNNWTTQNSKSRMAALPGGNAYSMTVHITSTGDYTFKLKEGDTYYGNSGTIETTNDKTNEDAFPLHTFFYTSDYDWMVISDGVSDGENKEYQTQDLMVFNKNNPSENRNGKIFDLASLTWFDATPTNKANLPFYMSNDTYLDGNFSTGNRWNQTRFVFGGQYVNTNGNAFNGTSASHLLCKRYIKSAGDYKFCIHYLGKTYMTYKSNVNLYPGNSMTIYEKGGNDIYAKNLKARTVYRFYLDPTGGDNGNPKISLYEGEN